MATIPGPLEKDAEDVSLALEVAQTQWARGDLDEALKWLRKAVDAAFEAEDDKRGIELSKIAAELAAEAKEIRKKPKPPPPRTSGTQEAPPAKRTGPPPAPTPAKPAVPKRSGSKPSADEVLETTGTRRAKATPGARRSPRAAEEPVHRRASRAASVDQPVADDDEATREYLIEDMGDPNALVTDEWPTEAGLDEIEEAVGRARKEAKPGEAKSGVRTADEKIADARVADAKLAAAKMAARGPRKREEPHPSKPPPKPAQTPVAVPSTRAVRVAASRAPDGTAIVRLLDASGLRAGEHDAMLVALTGDGDIRDLFR